MFKRIFLAAAVLVAAAAVFVALTLPPRRQQLQSIGDGTVAGIVHVHTNRSDGRSSPDEIAAAAAHAGLKFVVFTDHGDATRRPDPPMYRSGVLCLDATEISTNQGHYVALGLPPAPYPLAGDARDVVEDVKRLGGFGIAAHPDSPNPKLAWREWTAPFDGIELLNPDTSWRALAYEPGFQAKRRLVTALVDYPFRPVETIAHELRDSRSIASWQALAARRRVVAIGGVDAHAKLQLGRADDSPWLPFFGYESAFRLMSVHVSLGDPLTGNASTDGDLLLRAIRAGHLYTAVDGVATPPAFEFFAANNRDTIHEGDEMEAGGGVAIHVRSNAPPAFTTIVHRGTSILATARDAGDWTVHAPEAPAVYWVEIRAPQQARPMTWLRSNPIYIRASLTPPAARESAAGQVVRRLLDDSSTNGWQVEHDPASLGAIEMTKESSGPELLFQYTLGGGTPSTQTTALAYATRTGVADSNRIAFRIRADHPMRISVQLRAKNADRWQRSVYVDPDAQERVVGFDDMTPVANVSPASPPRSDIITLLFVVELTNTKPGTSGRVWLSEVRFER